MLLLLIVIASLGIPFFAFRYTVITRRKFESSVIVASQRKRVIRSIVLFGLIIVSVAISLVLFFNVPQNQKAALVLAIPIIFIIGTGSILLFLIGSLINRKTEVILGPLFIFINILAGLFVYTMLTSP